MSKNRFEINRAPVLTLWGAERLVVRQHRFCVCVSSVRVPRAACCSPLAARAVTHNFKVDRLLGYNRNAAKPTQRQRRVVLP